MSYHPLLNRQLLKAKCDDESIDVPTLLSLVSTAYQEKDIDRKRADHANRVMQMNSMSHCPSLRCRTCGSGLRWTICIMASPCSTSRGD